MVAERRPLTQPPSSGDLGLSAPHAAYTVLTLAVPHTVKSMPGAGWGMASVRVPFWTRGAQMTWPLCGVWSRLPELDGALPRFRAELPPVGIVSKWGCSRVQSAKQRRDPADSQCGRKEIGCVLVP